MSRSGRDELQVPVAGGELHVTRWGDSGPVVLAVHGITASSMSWAAVASALAGQVSLVAPDLRGRGRSTDLPGPYGFAAHAADLVAVLDALDCERAVVAGHSMGAFVAVVLARVAPGRVAGLVLVDGGLPGGRPEDRLPEGGIDAVLGPAAARLAMTFPNRAAYREFMRAHPAFAPMWDPVVEGYVDYDLVGEPPELHSSARADAMRVDGAALFDHRATTAALQAVTVPTVFLRAERGLLDAPPPSYPLEAMARWRTAAPDVEVRTVPDTNHYSILLGAPGARAVAAAIAEAAGVPAG